MSKAVGKLEGSKAVGKLEGARHILRRIVKLQILLVRDSKNGSSGSGWPSG